MGLASLAECVAGARMVIKWQGVLKTLSQVVIPVVEVD